MIDFCHCHCHSTHSFKDGLAPVDELVGRAAELGQPGIALTDHGVLYGAPQLFSATKKFGIKGIIGMEAYEAVPHTFDIERDNEVFKVKWADLGPGQDRYYHLTLWVLNLEGWQNLCALHSQAFSSDYHPTVRGKPLVDRASLEKYSAGLAVGLGCIASRTNVTIGRDVDQAYEAAKWYAEVFEGRCFMEHMANTPEQNALLRPQRQLRQKLGIPGIADNDVHYVDQADGAENGPHHTLVQARSFKKADTEVSTDKSDDGFGSWYGSDGFFLKSGEEMLATGGLQRDEITNTVKLLDMVDFDFSALPKPKPPIAAVPALGEDAEFEEWILTNTG